MNTPVIIIARTIVDDAEKRAFEDAVIDGVRRLSGIRVLVVPEASHLSEDHAGLDALRTAADDTVVYASWLYPRAARWLLRSLGVDGDARGVYAFGDFDTPDALVDAFPRGDEDAPASVDVIDAPARERWYPVLDYETCVNCHQCYDFCLFGVFTLNDDGYPAVTSGDNCKPGCVACARLCPKGAIMFPHHDGDAGIAGASGQKPAGADANLQAILSELSLIHI